MTDFLLLSFFTCNVIIAVNFVTGKGQLMEKVGTWVEKLPELISKPTVACPACMGSFWGTVCFWSMGYHYLNLTLVERLWQWPFFILCTSGAVRFLNLLLEATRKEAIKAPQDD